jgi:hypothetical protein
VKQGQYRFIAQAIRTIPDIEPATRRTVALHFRAELARSGGSSFDADGFLAACTKHENRPEPPLRPPARIRKQQPDQPA